MASAQLSRRIERVVGYPPLSEMGELQRREFHEALLEAATFEDLPGKWQAAIVQTEQNRPKLRLIHSDSESHSEAARLFNSGLRHPHAWVLRGALDSIGGG